VVHSRYRLLKSRVREVDGLTVASLLLCFGSITQADWLYFSKGGQAELPASVQASTVEVTTPDGRKSFPLESFRAIVPEVRLDDEWRDRRTIAKTEGSASSQFQAAWWALERGLTSEAVSLLRLASTSPGAADHAPLIRANRMLDRLELPAADPDLQPIQRELGATGWTELRGRHVLLLHQASTTEAQERLEVLDRVVETFYLSLAAQGIELPVPGRRLISVWFARQGDYIHFLRKAEAGPFVDTQGYYHPNFGAVFAFDTRSLLEQVQARKTLADLRKVPDLSTEKAAEIDRQSLLLDLRWRSVDLGVAAHETIHQLVSSSGLAPRFDDWPIWLHEGFSAQFEVVRGGRWAGFGRANDFRLPDWRSIRPAPQLAPLLRDEGLTHGYHRARYAESWAFVYFLRKARPQEFITFLDLLKTPRTSHDPLPTTRVFAATFGTNLDEIQTHWRRYMQDQTTPLEAHAKTVKVGKSP